MDMSLFGAVLLGLLFLLMANQPSPHSSVFGFMDMPRSKHSCSIPGALREDALRIMISRDGQVYLGRYAVAARDLPGMVLERLRNGAERRVYVAVDGRAQYGDVETVLEAVRLAGIDKLTFVMR
jgi:biopolymer transport protein ExbD